MVNRIRGGKLDPELFGELIAGLAAGAVGVSGYASASDAPLLVAAALKHGDAGTALVDQYIEAHADYRYIEYRNRSLWFVLDAVLRGHPDAAWARERLRRILAAALTDSRVDLPRNAAHDGVPAASASRGGRCAPRAGCLACSRRRRRPLVDERARVRDSWASHKRRLTALMELYWLVLRDGATANAVLYEIRQLPMGFAGFQAPAVMHLADAVRACGMEVAGLHLAFAVDAVAAAHNIQDYHFCARMTARANALRRWHAVPLGSDELRNVILRLAAAPGTLEFTSDHLAGETYAKRSGNGSHNLPIDQAREARTLEQMVDVFKRPAVEFRRVNPISRCRRVSRSGPWCTFRIRGSRLSFHCASLLGHWRTRS
jgi:hypothetical protein